MQQSFKRPTLIQSLGSINFSPESTKNSKCGVYACYCGTKFVSVSSKIASGSIKCCGTCALKPKHTHHRLYATWNNMMARCTNRNHSRWDSYGGRGIKVCTRWYDAHNFYEDMEDSFVEGLSLDRINNEDGYYKENCRWADNTTQAINTRLIQANNTSGYRGVSFSSAAQRWIAYVVVGGKRKYLKYHDTALDAAKAYNKYVIDNNLIHPLNPLD